MTTAHGDDDPTRRLAGIVYGSRLEGILPPAFDDHLRPEGSGREPCRRTVTVTYRPISRERLLAEAGELAAETEVECGEQSGPETTPEGCLWQSEPGGIATPGRFTLAGRPEHFRLAAWGPQQGLFEVRPERIDLAWAGGIGDGGAGAAQAAQAAHHLFAYAVPLWLETRGIPVLHGSAVTLGERAVGFLGPSGTGKSVLCAELVRLGAGFLADDGLALEPATEPERSGANPDRDGAAWRCLAGPPLLRLWPSGLARRLDLAPGDLPRIRPQGDKRQLAAGRLGSGDETAEKAAGAAGDPAGDPHRPTLAALYLLRRRRSAGGGVELSPQSPRQALFRLVEHGVAASPAAALGLEESRLQTLARVAEAVPLRELSFPTGTDSAAVVGEVLERDLNRLGG